MSDAETKASTGIAENDLGCDCSRCVKAREDTKKMHDTVGDYIRSNPEPVLCAHVCLDDRGQQIAVIMATNQDTREIIRICIEILRNCGMAVVNLQNMTGEQADDRTTRH